MKAIIHIVDDHGVRYEHLMFVCPGCAELGGTGLHAIPVNCAEVHQPSWTFDGNIEAPTLEPSILTDRDGPHRCHSYLRAGVVEFLADCAHSLAGQKVPLPELPEWVL